MTKDRAPQRSEKNRISNILSPIYPSKPLIKLTTLRESADLVKPALSMLNLDHHKDDQECRHEHRATEPVPVSAIPGRIRRALNLVSDHARSWLEPLPVQAKGCPGNDHEQGRTHSQPVEKHGTARRVRALLCDDSQDPRCRHDPQHEYCVGSRFVLDSSSREGCQQEQSCSHREKDIEKRRHSRFSQLNHLYYSTI
jgi:hypothetical protein